MLPAARTPVGESSLKISDDNNRGISTVRVRGILVLEIEPNVVLVKSHYLKRKIFKTVSWREPKPGHCRTLDAVVVLTTIVGVFASD